MASGSQNMTTDKARQAFYLQAPHEAGGHTDKYGNLQHNRGADENDTSANEDYWNIKSFSGGAVVRVYWETGNITGIGTNTITLPDGSLGEFHAIRGNVGVWMGIGSGNTNHGLYSDVKGGWMIYADGSGNVQVNGNAATATALTSNAGGTEQPIYFTGGKPSATSYALKATVNNGDANYVAYYSGTRAISSSKATTGMIMPAHYYHNLYNDNPTTGTNVYVHYYNNTTTSTNSFANLRVKSGSSYKVLAFGGDGTFTWNGTSVVTNSGTWGISITGNAGTATKLQTARSLWGNSFNGTADINGSINMGSGTAIKFTATAGDTATGTPTALTYGRLQAYGTLCINADTDGSTTEYCIITSGRGMSSSTADGLYVGYSSAGTYLPFSIYSNGSTRATLYLRSVANVPNDFWLGSNNSDKWSITCRASDESHFLGFYSATNGTWRMRLYHDGNNYCDGEWHVSGWVRFANWTGLYSPNNGAHFYPNNSTSYGAWQMQGTRGGYYGLVVGPGTQFIHLMDNGNDKGLYEQDQRWILYYNRSNGRVSIRDSYSAGWDTTNNGSFYATSTLGSGGLVQSHANGAIASFGAQNSSWVHITNNAGRNWYFDHSVYVDGTLYWYPNSAYYWNGNTGYSSTYYTNNWFRSYNATGWYNESYGGGIYMTDTTWVRVSHSKGLHVDNTIEVTVNGYPSVRLQRSDAGEVSQYFINNTAGWAIGINPWGVGAGQFAIGQYSGTGSSTWRFKIDNSGTVYTNGGGLTTNNAITLSRSTYSDSGCQIKISSNRTFGMLLGSGGVNRGLYDFTNNHWFLYYDDNNTSMQAKGGWRVAIQTDGNLVVYNGDTAYWSAKHGKHRTDY